MQQFMKNSVIKDERGNVTGVSLPKEVAPYIVQIIPKLDNMEKVKEAEELYNSLKEELF